MASIGTYYTGLTRQGTVSLGIETTTATFPNYINVIGSAEDLTQSYYYVSLARDSRFNSVDYPTEFFNQIETDLGITLIEGDVFISTPLQDNLTKEEKQVQKLDISAATRLSDSNLRATYDITQLPTHYDGDTIINNPNTGGLVEGRPWINTVDTFTFYEAFGTTTAISTTQYVLGNKIYAYASTYDVPSFQPARVVVNDIEVLLQGDTPLPYGRGHNLVVLDPLGDVVTTATQFDTYINPVNLTALTSAVGAVASGNIVVVVTYDASALDAGVRSAINTGFGSTNTNTWTAGRNSHIFIGVKI